MQNMLHFIHNPFIPQICVDIRKQKIMEKYEWKIPVIMQYHYANIEIGVSIAPHLRWQSLNSWTNESNYFSKKALFASDVLSLILALKLMTKQRKTVQCKKLIMLSLTLIEAHLTCNRSKIYPDYCLFSYSDILGQKYHVTG